MVNRMNPEIYPELLRSFRVLCRLYGLPLADQKGIENVIFSFFFIALPK